MRKTSGIIHTFVAIVAFLVFAWCGTAAAQETREQKQPAPGWLALASMPTARSSLQGASANGLLYAIGGNNGRDTPVVEAYNPASNSWSAVSPLNAPNYGGDSGRYGGSAIEFNGRIYMMGGWTNSPPLPSDTLSIYEPSSEVWNAGPAIPGSGFTACSEAAVIGSKIYLLNACNGFSGYVQQLSIFDTNTNSWTTGPDAPRNHNAGLGAALNGKFYVTGGFDGNGYEPQIDVYDPATNAWITVGSMPVDLGSMAGDVIDGLWYIVGGSDPTNNYTNAVWIYDPASNTWTSGPAALTSRCCAAAATINGKLYVVGGADSTGDLSTLEVLTPETPVEAMKALVKLIKGLGLHPRTRRSLTNKLEAALDALKKGNTATACGKLANLISEAQALSGKQITMSQANDVIDEASQIRTMLGC